MTAKQSSRVEPAQGFDRVRPDPCSDVAELTLVNTLGILPLR